MKTSMRSIVAITAILIITVGCALSAPQLYAALPKTNPTENFTSQPLPDQLLVKYKKDLSPQFLQLKVDERLESKSGTLGFVRIFFDNLKYKMRNQQLPEEHLGSIQKADDLAGAQEKVRVPDAGDENQRNLFLIHTDGSKSLEEVIAIYENTPEVEYAEPNYTAIIQNY